MDMTGHGMDHMDHMSHKTNHTMDPSMMGMDMMPMYFYFGIPSADILFKGARPTNAGQTFASCLIIFLAGLFYEWLKNFRATHFQVTASEASKTKFYRNFNHAAQSALHIVQLAIGYLLMLIFMTYNAWLCLALVLGAGLGFFVFGYGQEPSRRLEDCCH